MANGFGDQVSESSGRITNAVGNIEGPWSDSLIMTDVRLNRGYSGVPLLEASGKVIGMNTAVFANSGITVPISMITTIVSDLANTGTK